MEPKKSALDLVEVVVSIPRHSPAESISAVRTNLGGSFEQDPVRVLSTKRSADEKKCHRPLEVPNHLRGTAECRCWPRVRGCE